MERRIIGLMGFKGSGKDTVAKILSEYDYTALSFSESLKHVLCNIFDWDVHKLEGVTPESRRWREQVDPWWAEKLNIPDFTPRKAMTLIGTDLFRNHFNDQTWILSLLRKLDNISGNVVVTDIRFQNEYDAIQKLNGEMLRVDRHFPEWEHLGLNAAKGDKESLEILKRMNVHASEWDWLACDTHGRIDNTGSFSQLAKEIENKIINIKYV